jgi:hypothetical protein
MPLAVVKFIRFTFFNFWFELVVVNLFAYFFESIYLSAYTIHLKIYKFWFCQTSLSLTEFIEKIWSFRTPISFY